MLSWPIDTTHTHTHDRTDPLDASGWTPEDVLPPRSRDLDLAALHRIGSVAVETGAPVVVAGVHVLGRPLHVRRRRGR